jgi:alpha-L-rhamnosidase
MYLQALRYAAGICELLRDDKAATDYAWRAQALTGAITKYFWDENAKCWRDGFDAATNAPVEQLSQHANALALLLGLKPEHRDHIARDLLLKPARQRKGKVLGASPFFYAYVLEAMFDAGLRADGIAIIRERWGEMIDAGATTFWELWEVTTESRCHAWSASPVYHVMQQVLGVTSAEPGWKGIRIAPFVEGLEYAKGVVPSPLGKIRVEWEKAGEDQLAVRVDVPADIEAEFVSPLGDSRALRAGLNEFNT